MKVIDLIEALKCCDPEAEVCVEVYADPLANKVSQYMIKDETYVYIGDDLEELEYNQVIDYGEFKKMEIFDRSLLDEPELKTVIEDDFF